MKKNNLPEIYSLSDSDQLTYRKSISSSYNYSPRNLGFSGEGKKKNNYLIEKKNHKKRTDINEMEITPEQTQQNIIKNNHSNSLLCHHKNYEFYTPIISHHHMKKNEQDSFDLSVTSHMNYKFDNKSHSPLHKNKNEDRYHNIDKHPIMNNDFVDSETFKIKKQKYEELKEKYNNSVANSKNWRRSYFNLLKDSLYYEDTIKTLYEENRIHQEYIISLENKMSKLLTSCTNITTNFHNNLYKSGNKMDNLINNNNIDTNLSQVLGKNYNELLDDYKKQLEILSEEKDSLSTNLSISRHQNLQTTIKLEDLQNRIYSIEQGRYEDLKLLENVQKRQENM